MHRSSAAGVHRRSFLVVLALARPAAAGLLAWLLAWRGPSRTIVRDGWVLGPDD